MIEQQGGNEKGGWGKAEKLKRRSMTRVLNRRKQGMGYFRVFGFEIATWV